MTKLILEPKVIVLGKLSSSQDSVVVSPDGISPCHVSGHTNMPKILEPQVLVPKQTEYGKAVRKGYEQGNIKESRHNMTKLEPRNDGIRNTITTEQKDNLLTEPQVINPLKGVSGKSWQFEQQVYDSEGIARAVKSGEGSGNVPKVIEPNLRIPQATKQGYVEVPPGSVFDGSYPESKTRRGRVQGGGKISPTVTASGEPLNVYEQNYRIRKLTPRECFRLMGVSEENIDKIEASGVSKTQQYKMAGNSIVVDVLFHIFDKMFIHTESNREDPRQLKLFE